MTIQDQICNDNWARPEYTNDFTLPLQHGKNITWMMWTFAETGQPSKKNMRVEIMDAEEDRRPGGWEKNLAQREKHGKKQSTLQ